jgi:HAD superfamily hydrolase (TIGR01662 family)
VLILIKGVVFDLGMTLLRFIGDWGAAMDRGKRSLTAYLLRNKYQIDAKQFMATFGNRLVQDQKIRLEDHIERPTSILLQEVMSNIGYPDLPDDVIQGAMEQFYAESETYWIPLPSSTQVLIELRDEGYRLGLISNAGDENNVYRLIKKSNLDDFFDPILVSAAEGVRKPDTRLFEKVISAWELSADQVVMVGDTLAEDIVGAKSAGMHQIWLKENVDTSENQILAEEIQPELIAPSLVDIPEMIRKMSL